MLYLVVSSERGREGRERRERVRRLWAGDVGDDGRYVFVLPTMENEEENEYIIEESEEFKDILQTDIKLSDSHSHSKQVIICFDMVFSHFLLPAHLKPLVLPPLLQQHPLQCLTAR